MGAQNSISGSNVPLQSKSFSQVLLHQIADDIGSGNADEAEMQQRIGSVNDLKGKFLSASRLHLDEQFMSHSTHEFTDESYDEAAFRA